MDKVEKVEKEYTGINLSLSNFEGPLDLLLHLIKKSKLEIEEIELSKITEQYLEIIKDLSKVDMEGASEFIEVAATLIEIKSKRLLPRLVEETPDEEDPEYLLKMRLREYQILKESTEKLKAIENTNRLYKKPEKEAGQFRIVIKDMKLDLLLDAFTKILHKVDKVENVDVPKEIEKEKFTVSQKITNIKDNLLLKKTMFFSELFSNSISRDEVITTFLAVLELLKLQEIKVVQQDNFKDIQINKVELDG